MNKQKRWEFKHVEPAAILVNFRECCCIYVGISYWVFSVCFDWTVYALQFVLYTQQLDQSQVQPGAYSL